MLLMTLCATAKAMHADAAARPRVWMHVEVISTFAMPSYGTLLNQGNAKDGAGLRGVRSSG